MAYVTPDNRSAYRIVVLPKEAPGPSRSRKRRQESMAAKIEAREVSKRFGAHVALQDFSVEIAPGETFGLIGPNGAGKTTFLRILTGYWLPTAGDVRVDGISVVENPTAVQERLGYACEQPKLYLDHGVETFLLSSPNQSRMKMACV